MARAPKVCSIHGCPQMVVRMNRCLVHARELDRHQARTTPTKKSRTWRERQRRAQVVRRHRESLGSWCPGYLREPHFATDLTAEHVHAVGDGGAPHGELGVLCRECNSRHGAITRNRTSR